MKKKIQLIINNGFRNIIIEISFVTCLYIIIIDWHSTFIINFTCKKKPPAENAISKECIKKSNRHFSSVNNVTGNTEIEHSKIFYDIYFIRMIKISNFRGTCWVNFSTLAIGSY